MSQTTYTEIVLGIVLLCVYMVMVTVAIITALAIPFAVIALTGRFMGWW